MSEISDELKAIARWASEGDADTEHIEYGLIHDCEFHGCEPPHGDGGAVLGPRKEKPTHNTINGNPAILVQRRVTVSKWRRADQVDVIDTSKLSPKQLRQLQEDSYG
jgi:hypothetical protein